MVADRTCFMILSQCFVHVLKFQQIILGAHELLFLGAKDDFVIFASLCLCVSMARNIDWERVIAHSVAKMPIKPTH